MKIITTTQAHYIISNHQHQLIDQVAGGKSNHSNEQLTWSIILLKTGVTPRTEIWGNPIPRIPSNLEINDNLWSALSSHQIWGLIFIIIIFVIMFIFMTMMTEGSERISPHLAATKEIPGSWVASANVWSLTHTWVLSSVACSQT